MPDAEPLAGIAQTLERAEIASQVRTLIADRAHGRRLASTPSGHAESLADKISEFICSRISPWSRSSRGVLAERFRLAIQTVETVDAADDLPTELLLTVLQNTARRLDSKLAQISDRPATTKGNTDA